jgi:cell division protein FtsW (lipid II flippase)
VRQRGTGQHRHPHPDDHDVGDDDEHHDALDEGHHGEHAMTTVSSLPPKQGRNVELTLLLLAVGIVVLAYLNVGLAVTGSFPPGLLAHGTGLLVISLAFHLLLRWRASYADPLLLPIVTLLNGLGLVMIYRLDLAKGNDLAEGLALKQLTWSALAVAIAGAVLVVLRDHRVLRRYTFTAAAVGFGLLVLPLVPGLGRQVYGSRIWIGLGPLSFQPGEIAKIVLAVFFAGYLVQTRDVLSLAGRKVLGLTLPRARDLGPILVAWAASLGVLIFEKDLGSSLLFFGLFVAMLYVATERRSWIAIGLTLFCGGAYVAYLLFGHVQQRVMLWLDTFSAEALAISDQLARGLMGMASGGLLGTGLGRGRPDLTYFAESDFIVPSFGEEIGLFGVFALLLLYLLLVERGMRTALGVRDGFGKLLAAGLSFSLALQCFVVVGGVTRVIPLTGLTMPFLSYGGSSLLANWTLVAILLRISDHARRPLPEEAPPERGSEATEVVRLG